MQQRKLGSNGPAVPAIGLGCMGMSIAYGEPDDAESIATIHRALDLGVNLLVTSDAYGNGGNEELIARAIKGRRDQFLISSKFGNLGLAGISAPPGLSAGHPDYVMLACEKSLQRLGVDVIDFYGVHRVDPTVPIEDTVGAMKKLVEQGKVRYLVLSEAGPQTIRRIGFMAYAPLGRGFLTATMKTLDALLPKDRRREHPRFLADNIAHNAALLAPIEQIAATHGSTPAQIAIAWVLTQGNDIVPIPGTKQRKYIEQNAAAVEVKLSADEIALLSKAFPPNVTAGTRYPEKQLKGLGI